MTISTTTLKNAARALGYDLWSDPDGSHYLVDYDGVKLKRWDPEHDDGDSLRLAVVLKMQVLVHSDWVEVLVDGIQLSSPDSCYSADDCMFETTRRAIVLAASLIGAAL